MKIVRIRNRRLKARMQRSMTAERVVEILVSLLGLFVMSPVIALVSALVVINSPGPIFYRGARVGRGNSIFRLVKFRTLPVRYEERVGSRLLTEKERYSGLIAKLIIRLKLDELPQLFNVLRDEMALVGPRPVRPVFYSKFAKDIPGYKKRFRVKPGITGLAQIIGGYYMAPELKHKYDLLYIQNRSLSLDMKIIAMTFLTLLFSRNIMKTSLVRRFLGIPLEIAGEEITPTGEVYNAVTRDYVAANEEIGK